MPAMWLKFNEYILFILFGLKIMVYLPGAVTSAGPQYMLMYSQPS